MNFIDEEASEDDHDDVLVPSSQPLTSSEGPRPSKRRRLRGPESSPGTSSSGSDDYDLPSDEAALEDDFDNPKSKYDAVMHVPAFAESQKNEFATQADQPWSSPSAIRGPRWRKKGTSPQPDPLKATESSHADTLSIGPTNSAIQAQRMDPIVVDEFDDVDADIIEALMASGNSQRSIRMQSPLRRAPQISKNMRQTTLFGISTTQQDPPSATQTRTHNWPMVFRNEPPTHHSINKEAIRTWIYPLNVGRIRDYQYNIVYRALFHNILVALPTGLGKTFIAATVMLNYFNWTENAQIVFVAPTKPLVTQQVNACFHIAGIPRSQTTLLTGEISPAIRAEEWQDKRVFFMTPQTLVNDLKTGMADPKKIVLVVVDEAHKATGNYAYVEVVRFLRRFNSSFRVLALTATPGSSVEAVQKVIDGLGIARVEIRTEESMDIRGFVHARNENVELFDNSEEIDMCLDLFASAVKPVLAKVNSLNAYFSNDPKTMTLFGLMKGREQWTKSDAGRKADWGLKGMVTSCFKPLMSLAHNLELLKYHGIGPFAHKMKMFDGEASGLGKYAKQIVDSEGYKTMMNRLRIWHNDENFVGHPKLTYLNEVVLNHFMDAGDGLGAAGGRPPSDTRIMVFAHYRDSAEEIVRVLNRHQPMIRAHVFVGQSGTKGSEGMDQKMQIDIIKKFKAGTYNTLVATSIGEEGLDIGEVDLIVCYDCSKSPIRMLQRMGRTGRKRAGNIVLLLMRGKEERDYHSAKDNYQKMQGIIESGKEFQFHEDLSPRIVPKEIQPVVDKRYIDIPIENTQGGSPEPKKRKAKAAKRPAKKFHMPDGVETGFQYLGVGEKKKQRSGTDRVRSLDENDLREATLPPLQTALLSERDEEDLEKRYAQIAGPETQYVQPINFGAFPESIRSIGRTKLVKHSSATKRLIRASKVMHSDDRTWERPTTGNIIFDLPPGNTSETTSYHNNARIRARDDDNNNIRRPSDTPRTTSNPILENSSPSKDNAEPYSTLPKPFYVSQQSAQDDDSEDDLPSMAELFRKSAPTKKPTKYPLVKTKSKKSDIPHQRKRRVVSDDSDE